MATSSIPDLSYDGAMRIHAISTLSLLLLGACSAPIAGDGSVPADASNTEVVATDGRTDAIAPDSPAQDADLADSVVADTAMPDAVVSDARGGDSDAPDASTACPTCADYTTPSSAGRLSVAALIEASGLGESRAHPGVFYAQNDSGDTARFFALTLSGAGIGEFPVTGATAIDWEDLAVGPCGASTCVFLADTGDNAMARASYAIYRVPEPDVDVGRPAGTRAVSSEAMTFVYPDGSHNCETLLVHPTTGALYVVTKVSSGPSVVYRAPAGFEPGARVTLVRVGSLTFPPGGSNLATGGDIDPCGQRVLVRTYDRLWEYRVDPGAGFESFVSLVPRSVPVAGEIQGEAVAYRASGLGYVTLSEGAGAAMNSTGCR